MEDEPCQTRSMGKCHGCKCKEVHIAVEQMVMADGSMVGVCVKGLNPYVDARECVCNMPRPVCIQEVRGADTK